MRVFLFLLTGITICSTAHANEKELSCWVSSYVIGLGGKTSERIFGNSGTVEFDFLNQRYSVSIDQGKGMMSYDINEIDEQGFISGHVPMLTESVPFHLKFLDQTKKGIHTIFCRIDLEKS